MPSIVLVLGVLLPAAGCLSLYDGYGIIQVERGWAEFIAGATALSGGIVTIALWSILRRLQRLTALYEAALKPAALQDAIAAVPLAEPLVTEPLAAPSAATRPAERHPALAFVEANAITLHDVPPQPYVAADLHAAQPTHEELQPASEELPELYPEPAQEPVYVPALEPAFAESIAAVAAEVLNETPEPAPAPPTPAPLSAGVLAFDEMWKRVSEEIERPILAPMPRVTAAQHAARPSASTPVAEIDEAQPVPPEPTDARVAETAPEEPAAPSAAAVDEIDVMELFTEAPAPEPEARRDTPQAAPVAEPALIGRYEAEGTAYLMFDDGSIEAQSEAGVFRFASMADLKAFIEEKQMAE